MNKILSETFFDRNTKTVAKELLGKFLVRKAGKEEVAVMITETEAYDGFHDRASHAFKRRTSRTEIMFGQVGFFYVYLCYGTHYMLNVVTGKKDYPAAVLIRGVQLNDGKVLNGPGKITKFFSIDKSFNRRIASKPTGLWFENRGLEIGNNNIQKTARIGVSYAGPIWSAKKLRFLIKERSLIY